jgi:uncharacterized membrane protein
MYANGRHQNIGNTERIVSGLAGTSLLVYSAICPKKYKIATAIGGIGLVYRGVRGNSKVYDILGIDRNKGEISANAVVAHKEGRKVVRAVTINENKEILFQFWRDLRNLPKFMEKIESVQILDGNRSHWRAKGPGEKIVEWDSEIYNEIPNELISWRSLPGSDFKHAGTVIFRTAPNNAGTEVKVVLNYVPPAGKLGVAIWKLFRQEPGQQLQEDLRRLKQLMEAGEIPTTEGQPRGNQKASRHLLSKEPLYVGS